MIKYIKRNIKYFILSIIFSLLVGFANILLSYSMGLFTNSAINRNVNSVFFWSMITLVSLLTTNLFQALEIKYRINFSKKMALDLKEDIYDVLASRKTLELNSKNYNNYISLLQVNIDMIQTNIFEGLCVIIGTSLKILISSIALLVLNYKIFIIFIIITTVISFIIPIFKNKLSLKKETFSKKTQKYINGLKDYIYGIDTIILYLKEKNFKKDILKIDSEYENSKQENKLWDVYISIIAMALGMSSQILCMMVAAYFISIGLINIGVMITATQLLNYIVPPVSNLNGRLSQYKSTKKIKNEFIDLVNSKIIQENEKYIFGDLIYQNFSIDINGEKIYDKFNYIFKKGETHIILGKSGRGKSILFKSLIRKFNHYTGKILISEIDTKNIKSEELYANIVYISNSDYIFNKNIKDNISLYDDNIKLEEIIKKLNINLDIHNFKIDNLSSGERQRILLARGLSRNADVYIFDEPTNFLDNETKKIVNELIFSLKDKTVIVISHDREIEYINRFDNVLEL